MSTETVRFNVGGHKYEVSRSLLNIHPDTMLARSASEQWQEDPEAEIFIERNGVVFQYVLDYLRDSRVILPLTVPKDTLLQELQYYGMQLADENAIDDSLAREFQAAAFTKGLKNEVKIRKEEYEAHEKQARESEMHCVFHDFARSCFGEYVKKLSITVPFLEDKDYASFELANKVFEFEGGGTNKDCLNTYMSKVGLNLKSLETTSYIDTPCYCANLELVNSEDA